MVALPRLSIDEERKYVVPKVPKQHLLVVNDIDVTEEEEDSSNEGIDNDKEVGISEDSFGDGDEAVTGEDKVVCECEYCHKMISWIELTEHEQQCEQQLNSKVIEGLLN